MTKRVKDTLCSAYNRYIFHTEKTGIKELYRYYKRPSIYKMTAWARIINIDPDAVILSATCQFFSAAYVMPDPVTGELDFIVNTGRNVYRARLEEVRSSFSISH